MYDLVHVLSLVIHDLLHVLGLVMHDLVSIHILGGLVLSIEVKVMLMSTPWHLRHNSLTKASVCASLSMMS